MIQRSAFKRTPRAVREELHRLTLASDDAEIEAQAGKWIDEVRPRRRPGPSRGSAEQGTPSFADCGVVIDSIEVQNVSLADGKLAAAFSEAHKSEVARVLEDRQVARVLELRQAPRRRRC